MIQTELTFFQIENNIKQGTYCGPWDNPDYMWEAKTLNSNTTNDVQQQEKKGEIVKTEQQTETDKMEKVEQTIPEVSINELSYEVCKELSPSEWNLVTHEFEEESVVAILQNMTTKCEQLEIYDIIVEVCRNYRNPYGDYGYTNPDWVVRVSLLLKLGKIPLTETINNVPINDGNLDYTKYSELLKHYYDITNALSLELEANRKKEHAQQELLAASAQLQTVLKNASEEGDKLKKQNEALKVSLQEKDNEIQQKDELLAQLTEEAEARKGLDEDERNRYEARINELMEANVLLSHEKEKANNSPNKQAIINELVGEMVKEAQDWEHGERQAVNSLIMNTCADDLTPETKKKVRELKKKKSVPIVGGDLVIDKHVDTAVNGVQAGGTGVIVKRENKE